MPSTASTMQTMPAVSATFAPFLVLWLCAGGAGGCLRCGIDTRDGCLRSRRGSRSGR